MPRPTFLLISIALEPWPKNYPQNLAVLLRELLCFLPTTFPRTAVDDSHFMDIERDLRLSEAFFQCHTTIQQLVPPTLAISTLSLHCVSEGDLTIIKSTWSWQRQNWEHYTSRDCKPCGRSRVMMSASAKEKPME